MVHLFRIALLLAVACTQGVAPPLALAAVPGATSEAVAVAQGWMGRFSRREPDLATLLQANPGWGHLRDMDLFEAVQSFEAGDQPADRIGAARAYLALADLCGALDRLLIEVEGAYFASRAGTLSPAQRARRLVVLLRAGETAAVRAELGVGAPEGFGFTWQLAAARLAPPQGGSRPALKPDGAAEREMGQVAGYLWGLPPGPGGTTPYDQGVAAFRAGDLTGGVLTLQLLEFSSVGDGPGPELFLYQLLERAFAGLTLGSLEGIDGPAAQFLGAVARGHLDDEVAAEALYRGAATSAEPAVPAGLLFSPFSGSAELQAVARVRAGDPPAAGAGPLEALAGARTAAAVDAALGQLAETPMLAGGGQAAAVLAELYAARRTAGARWAARVLWGLGENQRALDTLGAAHRKSSGYRPDFVNQPGFLVDLARGRQRVGKYAPAVAVLFELAAEDPSVRIAYESLKRLYASHVGGEVPPR